MRKNNLILPWLTVICIVISLAACDTFSSVEYKIYNKTTDTVTVDMHEELLTSPYEGFTIQQNDSVKVHYGIEDSIHVAVLAPDMVLLVHREWSGLYREELMVHFWRYIKSITIGDTELPSSQWDNESAWRVKIEGGRFSKNEYRYYEILLR